MKKNRPKQRICFDCIHYEACQAWNLGSLTHTDASHCVNYRPSYTVDTQSTAHGKPKPNYINYCNSDGAVVKTIQIGYTCPFCESTKIDRFCASCGTVMDWDGIKEETS